MKQTLNIQVPNPCHENWNKMTTTEKGKFCKVCTKEVNDFTQFTDEQLIHYFNKNQKICGKFKPSQLNRNIRLERKNKSFIPSTVFASVFSLLIFNSQSVKAQEKPETEQTDKKYTSIPLSNTLSNEEITVSGTILDEESIPFPSVTVYLKGTTSATLTDFDGRFSITCNKGDVLQISYVGYKNLGVVVTKDILDLQLTYDEDLELLGEVVSEP